MDLNKKIYFQLADSVRHISPMQEATALILMFIAWWKHSKQRESAEAQRLDYQLGKSPADLWAAYCQIEGIATSSIEEAPFRLTHENGRFDPLIRRSWNWVLKGCWINGQQTMWLIGSPIRTTPSASPPAWRTC